MTEAQAVEIVEFIRTHYDHVSQEDYFAFSDLVLDTVLHDANQRGFARKLANDYPDMFEVQAAG